MNKSARLVIACGLLAVGFFSNAYALNLDEIKTSFLKGDYKQVIIEGEKMLAMLDQTAGSDELYYLLGLSYLKDGNYLRASDIFEIILREFPNSAFKEEASLGLADTYLFRGDFIQAELFYKDMLSKYPETKLKPQIYYRLSKINFKKDSPAAAKEYLEKLKAEFPANIESLADPEIMDAVRAEHGFYYTVQVGSFESASNAYSLRDKLAASGYDAFVDQSGNAYRVRVGKLTARAEAVTLENRLSREGYPTRIWP